MRPSLFIFTRWRPLVATVAMAAKEDVRVEGLVWDFHPLCVLYSWTTVSAVRVKKSWMVVIRPEKQECYGWLLPYMYSYSSPLQLPNNVVVEKGCGGGGEADSRLLSITGRKDKNLLSLCQHSSAQRDFIDQRTAMQEPLLHPTDTIYHAPLFPSLPSFHHMGLSVHPIMQKRHTQKKNFLKKKKGTHSGANDWEPNTKPVTQDITNGLSPEAPKATSWGLVVRHGLTSGQRGFFFFFLPWLTTAVAITGTFGKLKWLD